PIGLRRWTRTLESMRPDLIEIGDPWVPGEAGIRAARKLGVPVVAFHHSDLPRMIEQRVGRTASALGWLQLKRCYARVDLVLAPSRVMLERLQQAGIRRTALQPLGVDPAVFHPGRRDPELRKRLGLPPSTRLLVYAGRFAVEKHLESLVLAVERLGEPYHLLLVGARRRGRIGTRVTTLPYQRSSAALASILASADAFVHAGDRETFGLVIVEAMACGLPVVAVRAGALAELVSDTTGVLVDGPAPGALAAGVVELFERDVPGLGRAARQFVEECYSWDAAFRVLMQHYASVLEGSRADVASRAALVH
ncbi:MAG TPA: glycosyltransferase, partial [Steroidobacteraceae bacterium]|nr:glycosyltransferase [Steroidobacteraceae bacterium]